MNSSIAAAWQAVQKNVPLVHNLTNTVVQPLTANVLLAAGAAPAMVEMPEEAAALAGAADAVLINLGTINEPQIAGIHAAVRAAQEHGTDWVLDPVAIGVLPVRTALARELLGHRPTVIRGNASEVIALGGGAGGRGVDSTDSVDAARPVARQLAAQHDCIVAVSGEVDYITDGESAVSCANGTELLTRITGAGCSLGALIAAFCGANADKLLATAAAHAVVGVAAEVAAQRAHGPGSFQVEWLDALANLTAEQLENSARLRAAE